MRALGKFWGNWRAHVPLLSTQFRENAVLQADVPVTIWGSTVHDWGIRGGGHG